jgi:hypothetical protein
MRRIKPKKIQGVSCKVHPDLWRIMEEYRKKQQQKGVRKISQMNITEAIARNLQKKRRGMGIL